MKRPIAIGLAPNVSLADARIALREIVNPLSYTKGNATIVLEKWFEHYFSGSAIAFTSGRGALYAILKALDIGQDDEVILQAFTCAAVVQAVLSTGAKPIFCDITNSFTLDSASIQEKLTKKTKVILFQYTFGIAGDIEKIRKLSKEKNIYLIEDAAHTIGGKYNGTKLGTFGDASIFSFGRDKAYSCTSGGIAFTKDTLLADKLKKFAKQKKYPTRFWIFQNLLHPIAFYFLILPFYSIFVGKVLLFCLQRLKLLSFPVDIATTRISHEDIKKLPPALASLVLAQLKNIEKVNNKRLEITSLYEEKLFNVNKQHFEQPLLRYPILVEDQKKARNIFRKNGILVGNWYSNIIDPKGVDLKKFNYISGSCPNAERIAEKIINLPTYFSLAEKDIHKLIRLFNHYVANTTDTK